MAKGKRLAPGQPYAGRAPGLIPMNITIDEEAAAFLRQLAPEGKRLGREVSRLLHAERARLQEQSDEHARQAERRRLRTQVQTAVDTIFGESTPEKKSA
jgi:hypothetical protein